MQQTCWSQSRDDTQYNFKHSFSHSLMNGVLWEIESGTKEVYLYRSFIQNSLDYMLISIKDVWDYFPTIFMCHSLTVFINLLRTELAADITSAWRLQILEALKVIETKRTANILFDTISHRDKNDSAFFDAVGHQVMALANEVMKCNNQQEKFTNLIQSFRQWEHLVQNLSSVISSFIDRILNTEPEL